jgi:FkbM family methyltransferase
MRPSVPDPPELEDILWRGFGGHAGWDIGGNCGQTVLVMAWAFTRIVSFEPSPESFAYAKDSVARFGVAAELHNIAVSDHDGELVLAYPAKEQKETGQLVTIGTKGMEWEPEDWDRTEKVTVPCRTADSLAAELGTPDFMKVDTEGHEWHVLQGADGLVSRGMTDMLVEFHTPENQALCSTRLSVARYRTEIVRHPHYPPESAMWRQHGWIKAYAPGRRSV